MNMSRMCVVVVEYAGEKQVGRGARPNVVVLMQSEWGCGAGPDARSTCEVHIVYCKK